MIEIGVNETGTKNHILIIRLFQKCSLFRGILMKVLYGEVPPRGPNPYHLNTIFNRKGTPFRHLLLTNDTSFTYLVENFASF